MKDLIGHKTLFSDKKQSRSGRDIVDLMIIEYLGSLYIYGRT
jgi:hypothetical protein